MKEEELAYRCNSKLHCYRSQETRGKYGAFWPQVVSQAEASGRVLVLPDLVEVQGKRFEEPTIIIASHVGGMEDIPVSHHLCHL